MAFEFKIRGVSKEEKKKLYLKYKRLLRKNNKNIMKVIVKLFLELVYLYFDNPRRKLRKIFLPVILANLTENGSIHSVINEYREKKKLYSWSYTCRLLNLLDEDVGLEISKIFREILFKILKKKGFRNRGFIVAIDITVKPFYGNKNLLIAMGCKKKCGTNQGIHYLTASIVEEGVRFNLLCIPINQMSLIDRKIEEIINEAKKHIRIKLLFLDRSFANRKYCRLLKG